jgi:hypothetical protein
MEAGGGKSISITNTVTVEWPDYLIRNPYTAIRDNSNKVSLRLKRDLSKEQPHHKIAKTINVNSKFGMSRDTPFETKHTEIYATSKGIMNREQELS